MRFQVGTIIIQEEIAKNVCVKIKKIGFNRGIEMSANADVITLET